MRAVALHVGEVAHPAQQPVGDAWRAARAARDLEAAFGVERHLEQAGRAANDLRQLLGAVELEPGDDAEAIAQRIGQHAGARGRADQRERLQLELDRARRRALADHDVDLVVLQRRVEDLLDHRREAMDLVDEEDVVLLEVGQDRRRSLGFSSTGPEVGRRLTPSSLAMMCESVVLPRPGGPNSSTWSIASPRRLAAPMKISSCSRALAWPTYSASPLARSARSIASSLGEAGTPLTTRTSNVALPAMGGPAANSSVWMLMAHYRTTASPR